MNRRFPLAWSLAAFAVMVGDPRALGVQDPSGVTPLAPNELVVDVSDVGELWVWWWEYAKEPFLALRDVVHADRGTAADQHNSRRPTATQITGIIVPALVRALKVSEQCDLVSSCLLALGKAGRNAEGIDILAAMRARLPSPEQGIRETAALAMGVSRLPEAVPTLIALATDSVDGRALCERETVDSRTRCFATYGLGLLAEHSTDLALTRSVLESVAPLLVAPDGVHRDLRVAAIHALGLLPFDPSTPEGRTLFVAALDALSCQDLRRGQVVVQAQVAPVLGKLWRKLGRTIDSELQGRLDAQRQEWLAFVGMKAPEQLPPALLVQSAIIALGTTTSAHAHGVDHGPADDSLDAAVVTGLIEYATQGDDPQARWFALLALGQIGGTRARDVLLDALKTDEPSLAWSWAAIALGVCGFREHRRAGRDEPTLHEPLVVELLEQAERNSSYIGAAASIALGLGKFKSAGAKLQELLEARRNKGERPGDLCIALALLDQQGAIPQLREIVATSTHRFLDEDLRQAAIALGKLGDEGVVPLLIGLLPQGEKPDLALGWAIASALGHVGDARAIEPLVEMLDDPRQPDLIRAFAAVALGTIADPHPLPWNSSIAQDINYRATVDTLTNQSTGILDIL